MVILYLCQQKNTCSKRATETLEITEHNPNNLKASEVFYKKVFLNIPQNS